MSNKLDLLQRMGLDFPTILVFFTFLTGLVWAIDSLILAKSRKNRQLDSIPQNVAGQAEREADADADKNDYRSQHWFIDTCRSLFPVIFAVLIVRSFIVEPFKIPSDSMVPTLVNGDYILVNKFTYGIRLPVLNSKVIDLDSPKKGDVIVFRYPNQPKIDYIKRVVAVPGDRISYKGKVIHINGEPVKVIPFGPVSSSNSRQGTIAFQENLAGLEHMIYQNVFADPYPANAWRPSELYGEGVMVPEGNYFAMGDNRDNSLDSRFWGFVPEENLVGKAFFIWMNFGEMGRIGNSID